MSLLTDIEASRRRPGGRCTVAVVLSALPPDDAAELRHALTAQDASGGYEFKSSWITDALRKREVVLPAMTINRHRRGDCACH